ncbi:MAG: hypothetical protein M1370_03710 [Bacteroidetes bacterium]|nr:hypothetical protein [Bacteroidota bacterium]
MSGEWPEETVRAYRCRRYRQTPEQRLTTLGEAEEWLNEVGMCLFQPKQGVELPSLYGAVAGTPGPAPRWGSHSRYYGRAWDWKDAMLCSRRIFYGKALGDYRLFVSLEMFPYLFALSDLNYGGDVDDYLELYADGKLSVAGRDIYGIIARHGPVSTTMLRRRLGLSGGADSRRFERGLAELQRGLLISAVDIARDNRWKYTFAYDTTLRQFPAQIEHARALRRREAMVWVLRRYLDLACSVPLRRVASLFGWDEEGLRRAVCDLAGAGQVGWDERRGVVWRVTAE